MFKAMKHCKENLQCYGFDVVEDIDKEILIKDQKYNILEQKEFHPNLKHVLLRK